MRPWSRATLRAVSMSLLLGSLGLMPAVAPSSAAAPAPPLSGCLARGSFDIADPGCPVPALGDAFGPITSIQPVVVERGVPVVLVFDVDFQMDRPTRPCGDLGCPYNTVRWRPAGDPGAGITFVGGCGPQDATCRISYDPTFRGDAGERYSVVYAQHYDGIIPVRGTAYLLYVPPVLYPLKAEPFGPDGARVPLNGQVAAFAVRETGALESECIDGSTGWSAATIAEPPPCVRLGAVSNDRTHEDWFASFLPVDSGAWTLHAGVKGDPAAPIATRPKVFRPLRAVPEGDDIVTRFIAYRRPGLELALEPERAEMGLGETQRITVRVSSRGGEIGGYAGLAFVDGDVLAVDPFIVGDKALRIMSVAERPPVDGFTLGTSDSRAFDVLVRAVAEGPAELLAQVGGDTDLGDPVSVQARAQIFAAFAMPPIRDDGPEPPTIARALDIRGSGLDVVQGEVRGGPGTWQVVTLVTALGSRNGGTEDCPSELEGAGITRLGSVLVDIGPEGVGRFTARRTVTEGDWVYGYASTTEATSTASACVSVVSDLTPQPTPEPSPEPDPGPERPGEVTAADLVGTWDTVIRPDARGARTVRRPLELRQDRRGRLRGTLESGNGTSRLAGTLDDRGLILEVDLPGRLTSRFEGRVRRQDGTIVVRGTYRISNGETGSFTMTLRS